MEKIQELFNIESFSHHVYGFESHGLRNNDFDSFLNKERFSYIFSRHYDSFKIDDARAIKSLATEKTEKESIFIISFVHINTEAQNTLLKIIEEPRPQTTFFFVFPNAKKILPTILSRIELIRVNRVLNTQERKIDIKDFINITLQEQFDLIKELTNKKKADTDKFLKSDLQVFLDDLEIFYIKQKPNMERNEVLDIILKSRKYMNANAASIKMILDTIAIHL